MTMWQVWKSKFHKHDVWYWQGYDGEHGPYVSHFKADQAMRKGRLEHFKQSWGIDKWKKKKAKK